MLINFLFLIVVIFESLCFFFFIGQFINWCIFQDMFFGYVFIVIFSGIYVGYNCYLINWDLEVWGLIVDQFDFFCWGGDVIFIQKQFWLCKFKVEFIFFYGGCRVCFGEKFVLLQMRVILCKLLGVFMWMLDLEWIDRKILVGFVFLF